jgi:hypothetical protein
MTTTTAAPSALSMSNVRGVLDVVRNSNGDKNYSVSNVLLPISFNDPLVRRLANNGGAASPSGTNISMSQLRGKAGPEPYGSVTGQPAATCSGSDLYTIKNDGTYGTYTDITYGSNTCVPNPLPVNVLILGGGGGGHARQGSDNNAENGGGGAGGLIDANFNLPRGSYSFTIGSGGVGGNGGSTVAFGYTAIGGGLGGGSDDMAGGDGGSGGGSSGHRGSGGPRGGYSTQSKPTSGNFGSQPAYGNDGGGGGIGGGGGAGGPNSGYNGGPGLTWTDGVTYAGGGGGSYSGTGGSGGGGNGPGQNATNYGSGGGGGSSKNGGLDTTSGYQGIVIISYVWSAQALTGGTVTSSGSGASKRWFHAITDSSQTITF